MMGNLDLCLHTCAHHMCTHVQHMHTHTHGSNIEASYIYLLGDGCHCNLGTYYVVDYVELGFHLET